MSTKRLVRIVLASQPAHLGMALLLAAAALAGCAVQEPPPAPSGPVTPTKSPNDHWAYRYLELDNGLRVLLASDPAADKAAASLVVFRGSFHEPPEHPGLAHFLEHMLFLATEKYPEVDGYQTFITANGGSSNAYTAGDHTNYFFDIDPAHFRAGMDRFAQFFIAPSLDPAYVERERNAVHSEYQLQMKDDGWRAFAANKMALNPDHPGARFNIGSLDTLGEGVQAALGTFFQTHYSADQMALVAVSNEGLDEMQAWIAPMFGQIENRRAGPAPITAAPFPPDGLPATLRIRPQKELRSVTYRFPAPSTRPHYRTKPAGYITNLLGHEGKGSLHAQLKDKGWIESLVASTGEFDDAHAFIEVAMDLTVAGAEQIDAISAALFAAIEMLRSQPPEEWRHQERARMADLRFRFQEPSSAMSFVYRKGPELAHLPPQDLLRAPYLMTDFDAPRIAEYLSYLRPDNLLMEVVGPEVATDRTEPWFAVPYALEHGPITFGELVIEPSLPPPNPFLPENLQALADDEQPPQLAQTETDAEVWVDADLSFGAPRANLKLLLTAPGGFHSAADTVAAILYRDLVADALNEFAYPAELAGLSYGIGVVDEGYLLRFGGYTDRQPLLLRAVLNAFADPTLDAEKFQQYRSERVRNWRNFASERPYTQILSKLSQTLLSSHWPPSQLADRAERMTLAELAAWREARLAKLGLQALLHGNVNAASAQQAVDAVTDVLPLAQVPPAIPRVTEVDGNYRLPVAVAHDDAALVLFVQNAATGVAARAQDLLATHLLRQAFFTELRTERQLGYVVAALERAIWHRSGIGFVVQSPVASPAALEQAVLSFLDGRVPALEAMPAADFAAHKAGLISDLTEKDANLGDRTNRLWNELRLGFTGFDYNRQLADQVASLTQPAMLAFLRELRDKASSERLLIYSLGKFSEAPSTGQLVQDATWFKDPARDGTAAGSPATPGHSSW